MSGVSSTYNGVKNMPDSTVGVESPILHCVLSCYSGLGVFDMYLVVLVAIC